MGYRASVTFLCLILMSRAGLSSQQPQSTSDLFRFLEPSIRFSSDDKHRLDERHVIARILPAEGHELAALAAAAIDVTPDALVASARNMAGLKRSSFVPEIGRFSAPPRIEDLKDLTLDAVDVEEIVQCRPEHCGLKLRPEEIKRLQHAIPPDGSDAKSALELTFRQIVLERANWYLLHGDDESGQQRFSTLLQHFPYVQWRM